MRLGGEVPQRDRDLFLYVLAHHLDVVLQLRRDGNDRCALGDGAFDETKDLQDILKNHFLLRTQASRKESFRQKEEDLQIGIFYLSASFLLFLPKQICRTQTRKLESAITPHAKLLAYDC